MRSDDDVRGGGSESQLTITAAGDSALFHGSLDIRRLGGAGFASQRTVGTLVLNLSAFAGLELVIAAPDSDCKRYAITLKDEQPQVTADGRDASTVSWEADFSLCEKEVGRAKGVDGEILFLPWEKFRPTYRGRDWPAAGALDTSDIKRISFLMRRLV
jgi:hypothetical protein